MFAQLPMLVAVIIMGFMTLPIKGRVPRVATKKVKAPVHLMSCHRIQRGLLMVDGGGAVFCSWRSVEG